MAKIKTIYLKSFITGFIAPGFAFVFFVSYIQLSKNYGLFVWELILGPTIWALWNVLYFVLREHFPKLSLGVWGAILGFLFGISAILHPAENVQHAESIITAINPLVHLHLSKFNFYFHSLSWLWLPILFFIIWRYIIRWFNNLWGCKC